MGVGWGESGREGFSEELAFPLRSPGMGRGSQLRSAPGPYLDPDLGLRFCPPFSFPLTGDRSKVQTVTQSLFPRCLPGETQDREWLTLIPVYGSETSGWWREGTLARLNQDSPGAIHCLT